MTNNMSACLKSGELNRTHPPWRLNVYPDWRVRSIWQEIGKANPMVSPSKWGRDRETLKPRTEGRWTRSRVEEGVLWVPFTHKNREQEFTFFVLIIVRNDYEIKWRNSTHKTQEAARFVIINNIKTKFVLSVGAQTVGGKASRVIEVLSKRVLSWAGPVQDPKTNGSTGDWQSCSPRGPGSEGKVELSFGARVWLLMKS